MYMRVTTTGIGCGNVTKGNIFYTKCGNFGWLSERFSHCMSINDEM